MSLRRKIISGSSWVIFGHVASQIIRLGSNLLMTRLLNPDAFGLLAVVIVLMVGLNLFSDFGLNQSIVRSQRGEEPEFYNTVWTVQIIQGVVIFITAIAISVGIYYAKEIGLSRTRTVYADPQLPWIISVYSFCAVMQGFASTKVSLLRRHLKLKKIAQLELTNQLIALIVMIPLAYYTRSVWALVFGGLASGFSGMVLSHVMLEGENNKIRWNKEVLSEIFGYGRWIFLGSIIGFMVLSGDRILLSMLLDGKVLGIYMVAFLLSNAVQNLFQLFAANVIFSALSEVIRDRPGDFGAVVDKFQRMSDLMLLTTCGFLITASATIVEFLYDSRYHEAGFMLSIIAFGMIGSRYHFIDQCYASVGRPELISVSNLIRLISLIACVNLGFFLHGTVGALFGIAVSQFSTWPMSMYFRVNRGLTSWRTELLLLPEIMAGVGAGLLFAKFAPVRQTFAAFFSI